MARRKKEEPLIEKVEICDWGATLKDGIQITTTWTKSDGTYVNHAYSYFFLKDAYNRIQALLLKNEELEKRLDKLEYDILGCVRDDYDY